MSNQGQSINFGGCFVVGIIIFIFSIITKQLWIPFIAVAIFIYLLNKGKITFESPAKNTGVDNRLSKAFNEWQQQRKVNQGAPQDKIHQEKQYNYPRKKAKQLVNKSPSAFKSPMEIEEMDKYFQDSAKTSHDTPRNSNIPKKKKSGKYTEAIFQKPGTEPIPIEKDDDLKDDLKTDWSILPGSTSGRKRYNRRISCAHSIQSHKKQSRKAAYVKNARGKAPLCSSCRGVVPANASYCMHCGAGFNEGLT